MLLKNVVRQINGRLTLEACEVLYGLVVDMIDGGTILDLNCGEGRSTVVMALANQEHNKNGRILAVDTHITKPNSPVPIENGTLMSFFASLRTFRCMSSVVPIVTATNRLTDFMNKRSVNLVVIQIPADHVDVEEALRSTVEVAQNTVRKSGKIAVSCIRKEAIAALFGKDYTKVLDRNGLMVFEYKP